MLSIALKLGLVTAEEIIFRGALLPQLGRRLGLPAAIVLSALVFAAAHAGRPPLDMAILLLDGVAFGALYAATSSLFAPIAWHGAKNVAIWAVYGHGTVELVGGPLATVPVATGPWPSDGGAGLMDLIATAVVVGVACVWAATRYVLQRGRASG